MTDTLRTFLALTLEVEATAALAKLARQVARRLEHGKAGTLRPTRTEQLHLTLAFLGETPKNLVPAISTSMTEVASRNRAPTLRSDRILFLPKPRQARVVALGFSDEQGCAGKLAADLMEGLRPFGFQFESRPFLPHITLLRSREPLRDLTDQLCSELTPGEIVLRLRELTYFASFLGPLGARHEVLFTTLLPASIP